MKKKILALMSFVFVILIFFLKPIDTKALSYLSDKSETNYSVSSGLLTGKANTICQTEDGYIWIGQYAGLTKYDSKGFFTMTNYNGINLTSIVTLAVKGNILFIGSEKGFFIKDESGEIKKVSTEDLSLVVTDIKVIDDYAFVGTKTGLYRYDILDGSITRINNKNISRIAIKDKDTYYYLVGKDSIYTNSKQDPIFTGNIKSIYYYNNNLYIGTRSGVINIFNLNTNVTTTKTHESLTSTINDILINNDTLYVSADSGLFIGGINDSLSMVRSYGEEYNKMEKAFFDYENNLWLASSALGVYKISQNDIVDYSFEYDIPNNTTYAIERYLGYIYIATDDGLVVVDETNKEKIEKSSYENLDDEPNEFIKAITNLYNLFDSISIRDLEVFDNKIYFATQNTNGNLYYFDGISNEINYLKYDDMTSNKYESSDAKDYRCIRVSSNYLMIGLDRGIARYDGDSFIFKETEVYPLYIYEENDDLYVVLNTIGVVKTSASKFDTSNLERIDPNNTYSTLKCMYVNDGVLFSDNNDLYFAKDSKIEKINYNFVGSVVDLAYINDKYYVSTEASVYIIDDIFEDNSRIEILDTTNGLKSSLVANSSGYYDSDSESYYFATSTGVLKYSVTTNQSHEKIKRKVAIDAVYADGKSLSGSSITLDKRCETLTIYFSVLSFKSDQHYTVYYKLKGYDNEYMRLESSNSFNISYKNLSGGSYEFELYTVDIDGTLSQNTITIGVTKTKKITEEVWFWVLIVVLAILFLVALNVIYFKYRINKSIKRQNEYKAITLESIEAIARTIDAKDSYTNGHSKRVGIYSREIAKALNLSSDEVENIYYIALLHDIGKIAIPGNILNKPGKLTDEEFEVMKSHTTAGAKILDGITTIPHIVEGAKYHHEKYGGGGYPEGLKGEEIPFIARIICCADCYDAMATKRVYKEPYPKEKIISEFERCKNIQFDPQIADVVIKLIKEDRLRYGTELKKEDNN